MISIKIPGGSTTFPLSSNAEWPDFKFISASSAIAFASKISENNLVFRNPSQYHVLSAKRLSSLLQSGLGVLLARFLQRLRQLVDALRTFPSNPIFLPFKLSSLSFCSFRKSRQTMSIAYWSCDRATNCSLNYLVKLCTMRHYWWACKQSCIVESAYIHVSAEIFSSKLLFIRSLVRQVSITLLVSHQLVLIVRIDFWYW